MTSLILSSLYFILPAYFANMFPVVFAKIKLPVTSGPLPLGAPVNKKLFGSHKSWRGFYAGYLGALIILYLQFYLQKEGLTQPADPAFNGISSSVTLWNPANYGILSPAVSIDPSASGIFHPLGGFPPTLLNYENISLLFYAFLFGLGALTGDLIKSFFKRRLSVKPGRPFFPFDQLDFVIGALIFLAPFYILPWQNLLVILIITPLLHFLTNLLGYLLKLKKVWW